MTNPDSSGSPAGRRILVTVNGVTGPPPRRSGSVTMPGLPGGLLTPDTPPDGGSGAPPSGGLIPFQAGRRGRSRTAAPAGAAPADGWTAGPVTFKVSHRDTPALECADGHVTITGPFTESAASILAPLAACVAGNPARFPLRDMDLTVTCVAADEFPAEFYPAVLAVAGRRAIIAVCDTIISPRLAGELTRLLSADSA